MDDVKALPFDFGKDFPDLKDLIDDNQLPMNKQESESGPQFKIDESLGPRKINDLLLNDQANDIDAITGGQSLAAVEIDYSKIKDLADQIKDEKGEDKDGFVEVKHSEAIYEKAQADYKF